MPKIFLPYESPYMISYISNKIFLPYENPYKISYLTSIDFFSPSRTVFEIFDSKVLRI